MPSAGINVKLWKYNKAKCSRLNKKPYLCEIKN